MFFVKNKFIQMLSGNYFFQCFLEKNVKASQYLMGIGSGAGVFKSGEEAIFRMLQNAYKPPYCIFDVGSNKGQFLDLTLEIMHKRSCTIHCFEPGNEAFSTLIEKHEKLNFVKFNNFAISNDKGESTLYFNKEGSTLAAQTKRNLSHFSIDFDNKEKILTDSIDNYCDEHAISQIDLLKIDIEGHELNALCGASNMLSKNAIGLITFEFGGANIDTRTYFQDFWYFFQQFNFSLFRITPSGYLFPIRNYKEIDEQFRTTNFVAVNDLYA